MAEIGNVTVRVDTVITDEQYREAMGAVRAANERMDLLKAENAKLRELVRDLYEGLNCPTESYEGCPSCAFNSDYGCLFELRIQELGVETGV